MAHPGIATIRSMLEGLDLHSGTIEERRAAIDPGEGPSPIERVALERIVLAGRPAERLTPDDGAGEVVLYLHGGAYCIGGPGSHRGIAARLAQLTGYTVVTLDYRMAPEDPFPAAVDDAVDAYEELLADGRSTESIAIAGDSAGGGLTAATLVALRDRGLPLPAAGVCLSPWADLTQSSASFDTADDPMVSKVMLDEMAAYYLAGADARTPLASPVFADLTGLPPLLIHVGSDEVLHDDAITLAARATDAGVDTTVKVWPDMIHVFQLFPGELVAEADESLGEIAAFLADHVRAGAPAD